MSALLKRLSEHARLRPHAPAVQDGARTLGYRDLWQAAGGTAARILAQPDLPPEPVIALEAPRSLEWIVYTVGAWMAGAAPLFLDPSWPEARRAQLVARAEARQAGLTAPPRAPDPDPIPGPEGLAYVIASSGSTGSPKLIEIEHRGLGRVLDAQVEAFEIGPGDRIYWMLNPAFDASLSDVGCALWAGATVLVSHARPEAVFEDMRHLGATHVDLPPALMAALDPERAPASLRTVIFGGEPSPPERLRRWARRLRLVQAYGPTEATICTHLAVIDAETWRAPDLGQPIAGTRHRVEHGELWLAGPQLMRGYRGDPALTAQRIVEQDGLRWYRTGDHVALDGGRLIFIGRVDRQLKLAGRLVAPEEVEAALSAHPSVERAVVRQEGLRLVAHVQGAEDPTLEAFLRARLPEHLRPARIEWGPLPALSSGKVDRRALDAVEGWRRRFEFALRRPVGDDDRFFDLGADSLAVLELVAAAEADGLTLDVATLHAHPSPRTLAEVFSRGPQTDTSSGARPLVELDRLAEALTPHGATPRGPPKPPARVLLTGATGFLGAHLLAALEGRARVSAVVRDPERAEAAFARARARYDLRFESPRLLRGDVRQPGFGLADPEAADACDGVIHAAGALALTAPFEALLAVNARGLAHAITLAQRDRPRPLVHAGSLVIFVAGDGPRGAHLEASVPGGAGLRGAYAQSKYVADVIARSAPGVRVANVRLGLLVGDRRTYRGAPEDWLGRAVRGWGTHPPAVPDEATFDAVPVDHAAEVIARLALDPPPRSETFHVAGPEPMTMARLRRALAGAAAAPTPDPAARLARGRGVGPAGRSPFDLFLSTGHHFDTRATEARTHLVAPHLDDADWLRYVEAMQEAR